jgi:hypothetical protein
MRSLSLQPGRILLLVIFLFSHIQLVGCNDDSKTSGTVVPENPEAVAHRKAKAEVYKSAILKRQTKPTGKKR